MGAAGADFSLFDNGYFFPQLIEVEGTADTDGAAADDQGSGLMFHGFASGFYNAGKIWTYGETDRFKMRI